MKKRAIFLLNDVDVPYSPEARNELKELLEITAPPMTAEEGRRYPKTLAEAEVLLSGWGCPRLDERCLKLMPRLEAVFYAAGSVRYFVSDAFWARNIVLCSAWAANAIPVADFTLAQIILALKHEQVRSRRMHARQENPSNHTSPGAYRVRIGLIGLGMVGRLVLDRLRILEVEVLANDPTLTPERAAELGVRLADLNTIFAECHVVSLHAPLLNSTVGLITGEHFKLMRPGATFINTSRGAIVREEEMIAVLQKRPDLVALLDVTRDEPPKRGSPLYTMPNVFLTPHLAGSVGHECWRMGDYMRDEVRRYLRGEPLRWQLTQKAAESMA